ncbi:GGDEF domain-containing phosphodiesterase [Cellulomonas endophytica]|uniref:EAL domain-containing protein n=1 Tax=Cellulomonas endophytica TaxID=2494735 RepID=UPI001012F5D6|nr:GGDEF domain-containing phosphodiesterase [Cellulomonas endophytica]
MSTQAVVEDDVLGHVQDVVRRALEDLQRRSGLESWVLARRDGEDYVVLDAVGESIGRPGDARVVRWEDTFCAVRDAGAPAAADDVRDVPAYLHLARRTAPRVRAVLTVPVVTPDGDWVGALCGLGSQPVVGLDEHRATAEVQAALLGSLLAFERHALQERRRAERAEAAALTDPLTGLGNRRAWDLAVRAEEERSEVLGTSVGVVVADLDGMKAINDGVGHAAGDDVLVLAGEALRSCAAPEHLAARLGGDELGLLLPDTGATGTSAVVDALRAAWERRGVEVSVGWAVRRAGSGLQEAWRQADAAMYVDKQRRRLAAPGADGPPSGSRPPRGAGPVDEGALAALVGTGGEAVRDVDALLRLVSAQLGLDVAFVNERLADRWRFRAVHAGPSDRIRVDDESETADSFCELLVQGSIPAAVPDTTAEPALAALPIRAALDIAAYVGTPLHRSDGSLYGTLCAYSHGTEPALSDRDAGVLRVVGSLVMGILERQDRASAARHALLARLDGVLGSGGPTMVFQPVVALARSRVVGHEALSRFPDGDPGAWFDQARAAGVEEDLELAAVRCALAEHARAQRGAGTGFVAVNVSARTAGLPSLARALDGVDPARVVLELTEHVPVEDYGALRRSLAPLRARGVRLAVDDVGAGFASMRHVLELVPDLIKLDIGLVRNIGSDSARQALAASMLAFADATGADVVAEGIETPQELAHLRRMGVGLGQGYHLGRPAPLVAV